ncbi:MAG: enoyl-CoA hydratase/isomerase family protein [Deltaproteobacteria bacterium]|nr:enoyl-CoA hydratase/isomerase family protein [Deltaproteobacteria bacterium]
MSGVLMDVHNNVATLTLNRPAARNAMSKIMVEKLAEFVRAAEHSDDVRVILLRGAGSHFCAGGDIKDMAAARAIGSDNGDAVAELNASFGHVALAFASSPLPVVVELKGAVMGGGFGLACVADVVVASETTLFRLPETRLGVVPAQIAPFLVERIGFSEAKRLALTGASLDAKEALAIRLVHDVVPEDDLECAVDKVVQQICAGAPQATSATKSLLLGCFQRVDKKYIEDASHVFAHAARSEEAVEGMTAFIEKRSPQWSTTRHHDKGKT